MDISHPKYLKISWQDLNVFTNDKIQVQFDHKYLIQTTPPIGLGGIVYIASIYLEGAANNYYLKENGEWELESSISSNDRFIKAN